MKDSVGVLSKVRRGKCKRIGGFCGFFGGVVYWKCEIMIVLFSYEG